MVDRTTATTPTSTPDDPSAEDAELIRRAVMLATEILLDGNRLQTARQRSRGRRLAKLMRDPDAMALTFGLTDEVTRIGDPRRAATRLHGLVASHGTTASFGPFDRALLRTGALAAPLAPRLVMPLVRARLRRESEGVVVPAEERDFTRALEERRVEELDVNVNVLGEAVLGDAEATARLQANIERFRRPDVDYVSVKASSICAQISSLAFERSVDRVTDRLRCLFAAAAATDPPTFVNIDMEEHRDLEITVESFMRVLDEPGLRGLDAGIVLQAYLPDAHEALDRLATWAVERHRHHGGSTKVRVVKGANLLMERADAELHGWPQAPYTSKADADASWKRLVDRALDPRLGDGLRVGAGSHNLFDVAYALVRADQLGTADRLDIEMLSGMADGHARAARSRARNGLRLYTPVVERDDFEAAVAYLVRRLDEGTEPDNFLPHLFGLEPGTAAFADERRRFARAVENRHRLTTEPRRTQDRSTERLSFDPSDPFTNEPDTDWSLSANREWLGAAVAGHRSLLGPAAAPIDVAAVDAAVARAAAAARRWGATTTAERRAVLTRVAETMAAQRGESIARMGVDAHKTPGQADTEVSEAIDFARWYASSTRWFDDAAAVPRPRGVVVVTPPWNFPYAIPAGGTLGAIAAGNAVILKPAPEAVGTAALLHEHLLAAGVPADVVQFVPAADDDAGRRLVTHPDVAAVILTGAADTAARFLDWAPRRRLLAETSGKNAIVVTAAADLDLAVHDVTTSAFAHSGQKCSAASLVIVEQSVLDTGRFTARLVDAARTLHPGPATDPATDIAPLIRPASGWLAEALTRLEPGERWELPPRHLDGDLWTPGIKSGVRRGSASHLDEWFGPVLGIMAADDLDDAIDLQNETAFGLTGGIHSLDAGEIDHWLERVQIGNAYVNRHITGAVVGRQPFGGWKRSVVGPGAKAGGPGYVASLCFWADRTGDRVTRAAISYREAWRDLGTPRELAGLAGEANLLRHVPLPGVIVRVQPGADPVDLELCRMAARTTRTPVTLSEATDESDDELVARLADTAATRLRVLGEPLGEAAVRAAHRAWIDVMDDRPVADGHVELRRWVREQSISRTTHRYGVLSAPPSAVP